MSKEDMLEWYLALPYRVEIYPDDQGWVAAHPELGKDICRAHGLTPEKALKNLEVAKNVFMKMMFEAEEKIPTPTDYAKEEPILKRNIFNMVKWHSKNCDDPDCGVTLILAKRLLRRAGISVSDKESEIFQ